VQSTGGRAQEEEDGEEEEEKDKEAQGPHTDQAGSWARAEKGTGFCIQRRSWVLVANTTSEKDAVAQRRKSSRALT
jgi:hypothetical protein